MIISLEIDENRVYALTKYANKNGVVDVKESDHNGMILKIKSNWNTSVEDKTERMEIYNYKNKEDFMKFQKETEDNESLRECFNDETEDLDVAAERWLSLINKIIQK